MLTFRVFGFPTRVEAGFWIMTVVFGLRRLTAESWPLFFVWAGVVFFSILIHELGHAFAMRRYGIQPEITLHMMGGMASYTRGPRLTRRQQIWISFAGPLAQFILGGVVLAVLIAAPSIRTSSRTVGVLIHDLLWVNFGWALFNLLPVLPLDGGHILEALLGPKREALVTRISLVISILVVAGALYIGELYIAILIGYLAYRNYLARRALSPVRPASPRAAPAPIASRFDEPIPPEIVVELKKARAKLDADRYDEAGTMAELVLAGDPPPLARVDALHIIGWAHLLEGRADQARRVLNAIAREGIEPDAGLAGATLLAVGELDAARSVTEAARTRGDDRKEVVGTLIQILVQQKQITRAAAVALDIVDSLSDEDIEQMAQLAFEEGGYAWSSRLSEALIERTGSPDAGYDAARSRALEGDSSGSLVLLRKAVEAGFCDAARVWSDEALAALQSGETESELAALLPRPSTVE